MTDPAKALASVPSSLRSPLLAEYRSIVQNYMERRWAPAELSGGKFCETVYTILEGHAAGKYAVHPSKPRDLVTACRGLENNTHVPRSFRILIPRLLPALYEVRNSRGVGHVGGDLDPNHMDATVVISTCNWIMAELIRVFHRLTMDDAQAIIERLTDRRIPFIWHGEDMRRVLDTSLKLEDQLLLLIASSTSKVQTVALLEWSGYGNKTYFQRVLRKLHTRRMVELSKDGLAVELLPPGSKHVSEMMMMHVDG